MEEEVLWNCRDGVTPFIVPNRDKTKDMQHVDWGRDIRRPDHRPRVGDGIFVNMTFKKLLESKQEAGESARSIC